MLRQNLEHDMLHPRIVLGSIVAENLERVGPHTALPLEVDGTGKYRYTFVLPVLGLYFVLLDELKLLLEVEDENHRTFLQGT